jgi:hypothetical protein
MPRANRQAVTQTGMFQQSRPFRISQLDQTLDDATAETWADIKTPSFREQ